MTREFTGPDDMACAVCAGLQFSVSPTPEETDCAISELVSGGDGDIAVLGMQ